MCLFCASKFAYAPKLCIHQGINFVPKHHVTLTYTSSMRKANSRDLIGLAAMVQYNYGLLYHVLHVEKPLHCIKVSSGCSCNVKSARSTCSNNSWLFSIKQLKGWEHNQPMSNFSPFFDFARICPILCSSWFWKHFTVLQSWTKLLEKTKHEQHKNHLLTISLLLILPQNYTSLSHHLPLCNDNRTQTAKKTTHLLFVPS